MLFSGIDGIGKHQLATRFAMTINCLRPPAIEPHAPEQDLTRSTDGSLFPVCDICPSCKKIRAGQHPDIIHIRPAGHAIKIEQIRSLRQILSLKPYEASQRVAIIDTAALMTLAASNALLKILEEPPERTTLILIANKPSDLIATIVSRCQQIRFAPVDDAQMINELTAREKTDPTHARVATALAEGSMNTAKEMLSSQWQRQRSWILNELIILCRQAVAGGTGSPRQAMALAELLAADRSSLDRMLVVMKSWFRDLAIWPFMPENIIHQDYADAIGELASTVAPDFFFTDFIDTENLVKESQTSANLRLALESYFIGLAEPMAPACRSG